MTHSRFLRLKSFRIAAAWVGAVSLTGAIGISPAEAWPRHRFLHAGHQVTLHGRVIQRRPNLVDDSRIAGGGDVGCAVHVVARESPWTTKEERAEMTNELMKNAHDHHHTICQEAHGPNYASPDPPHAGAFGRALQAVENVFFHGGTWVPEKVKDANMHNAPGAPPPDRRARYLGRITPNGNDFYVLKIK